MVKSLSILVVGSAARRSRPLEEALTARGHTVRTFRADDADQSRDGDEADRGDDESFPDVVASADTVVLLSAVGSLTDLVSDTRTLDLLLSHMTPGATLVFGSVDGHGDAGASADPELQRACETRVLAADDWLRGVVVRRGLAEASEVTDVFVYAVESADAHGEIPEPAPAVDRP